MYQAQVEQLQGDMLKYLRQLSPDQIATTAKHYNEIERRCGSSLINIVPAVKHLCNGQDPQNYQFDRSLYQISGFLYVNGKVNGSNTPTSRDHDLAYRDVKAMFLVAQTEKLNATTLESSLKNLENLKRIREKKTQIFERQINKIKNDEQTVENSTSTNLFYLTFESQHGDSTVDDRILKLESLVKLYEDYVDGDLPPKLSTLNKKDQTTQTITPPVLKEPCVPHNNLSIMDKPTSDLMAGQSFKDLTNVPLTMDFIKLHMSNMPQQSLELSIKQLEFNLSSRGISHPLPRLKKIKLPSHNMLHIEWLGWVASQGDLHLDDEIQKRVAIALLIAHYLKSKGNHILNANTMTVSPLAKLTQPSISEWKQSFGTKDFQQLQMNMEVQQNVGPNQLVITQPALSPTNQNYNFQPQQQQQLYQYPQFYHNLHFTNNTVQTASPLTPIGECDNDGMLYYVDDSLYDQNLI